MGRLGDKMGTVDARKKVHCKLLNQHSHWLPWVPDLRESGMQLGQQLTTREDQTIVPVKIC